MDLKPPKYITLVIPFNKILQTLAATLWLPVLAFGGYACLFLSTYLVLFTSYRWLTLIYLLWIWVVDKDICDRGGRRFQFARKFIWWRHFQEYFPVRLERIPGAEFDAKRNYLFGAFPHGVIPVGNLVSFLSGYGSAGDLFPDHTVFPMVLRHNFFFPFFRDVLLATGAVSPSADSLNNLLGDENGGNIAVLNVGGVAESYYCRPGNYRICLRNRKGFVKVALKNGAPLVPVFSFGEPETYDQLGDPDGSRLHYWQERIRRIIGIAPLIVLGRGSFGLIPRQVPITCVVGKPIEVFKSNNPTEEEIDLLHQKFCNHLEALFEEHKHKYIPNSDNINLVIS